MKGHRVTVCSGYMSCGHTVWRHSDPILFGVMPLSCLSPLNNHMTPNAINIHVTSQVTVRISWQAAVSPQIGSLNFILTWDRSAVN